MKKGKPKKGQMKLAAPVIGVSISELKKSLELLDRYACPTCDKLHEYRSDAEDCHPHEVPHLLICPVCEKQFDYWFRDEAEAHLLEPHGTNVLSVDEKYFAELQEGKPNLGQWVFTEYEHIEDPEVFDRLVHV